MLPGEFLTLCQNKKLDWSAANIMLASTLMWASATRYSSYCSFVFDSRLVSYVSLDKPGSAVCKPGQAWINLDRPAERAGAWREASGRAATNRIVEART